MEKYKDPLAICGLIKRIGNTPSISFFIASETAKLGETFYCHGKMGIPNAACIPANDNYELVAFKTAESIRSALMGIKPTDGVYVLTCDTDILEEVAFTADTASHYTASHLSLLQVTWHKVNEYDGTIATHTAKETKAINGAPFSINAHIYHNPTIAINHVLNILNPILDASVTYNAQRLCEIRAEKVETDNLINTIIAEQNNNPALGSIVESFDPNIWWNGLTRAEKLRVAECEIKQK